MSGVRGLYYRGTPPSGKWWLSISVGGQRWRGSTGISGGKPGKPPREAELFRAQKLVELGRGNMAAMESERLTIADLVANLLARQKAEGRVGAANVEDRTRFFVQWYGMWKAIRFTPDHMLAYALRRKDAGAAIATINTEIAYLRRGYALAVRSGRLAYVPLFERLPGANKRYGTIDDATLDLILEHLRPNLRPVVRFLRLTGWRKNEGAGLEWRRVDWPNQQIRLDTSKTGRPRAVPWSTYPALEQILLEQRAKSDALQHALGVIVSFVFPDERGKRITSSTLDNAWRRACIAAHVTGVPHSDGTATRPMIHDLRRTLSSEMDRQGVPWSVQKAVTGHESDRQHGDYVIAQRRDVEEGLRKLAGTSVPETLAQFRRRD